MFPEAPYRFNKEVLESPVQGFGFRVSGLGVLGCRDLPAGFQSRGLGFRVESYSF